MGKSSMAYVYIGKKSELTLQIANICYNGLVLDTHDSFYLPTNPRRQDLGQNIPPANMPHWHKDYFKLKVPKKTAGARRTHLPHLHFLPEGRR